MSPRSEVAADPPRDAAGIRTEPPVASIMSAALNGLGTLGEPERSVKSRPWPETEIRVATRSATRSVCLKARSKGIVAEVKRTASRSLNAVIKISLGYARLDKRKGIRQFDLFCPSEITSLRALVAKVKRGFEVFRAVP